MGKVASVLVKCLREDIDEEFVAEDDDEAEMEVRPAKKRRLRRRQSEDPRAESESSDSEEWIKINGNCNDFFRCHARKFGARVSGSFERNTWIFGALHADIDLLWHLPSTFVRRGEMPGNWLGSAKKELRRRLANCSQDDMRFERVRIQNTSLGVVVGDFFDRNCDLAIDIVPFVRGDQNSLQLAQLRAGSWKKDERWYLWASELSLADSIDNRVRDLVRLFKNWRVACMSARDAVAACKMEELVRSCVLGDGWLPKSTLAEKVASLWKQLVVRYPVLCPTCFDQERYIFDVSLAVPVRVDLAFNLFTRACGE